MASMNRRRNSRLTLEEQWASARLSFVSAGAQTLDSPIAAKTFDLACRQGQELGSTAKSRLGACSCSLVTGVTSNQSNQHKQESLQAVRSSATFEVPRCSADVFHAYAPEAVQDVLEQILPAMPPKTRMSWEPPTMVCGPAPNFSMPADFNRFGMQACDPYLAQPQLSRGISTHSTSSHPSPCHSGPSKTQRKVLEHVRKQMLRKFGSVHAAFSRLTSDLSRDRLLTHKELHAALERLGLADEVDSDELFQALDTGSKGHVSLCGWLHALVALSPEASLWELRCRLRRVGIGVGKTHKVLELIQWPQHGWQSKATKLKRLTSRRMCNCCACAGSAKMQGIQENAARDSEAGREQAMVDADFEILSDEIVRKRVRPSSFHLTRGDWLKFCTSICLTLLEAERLFELLADDMRMVDIRSMFETLRLTVTPDASLENFASKVIQVYKSFELAFAACSQAVSSCCDPVMDWEHFHALAVSLDVNDKNAIQIWGMLAPPSDILDVGPMLKYDFGSDEACALALDGQECSGIYVSQASFLHALSLWAPHTALAKPATSRRERRHSTGRRGPKEEEDWASSTVRNETLPFWQSLRTVKSELQLGVDDNITKNVPTLCHTASTSSLPDLSVDKRMFSKAVRGAVRCADNRRSKLALHIAHSQVLNLEKRWATPSSGMSARSSGRAATPSKCSVTSACTKWH